MSILSSLLRDVFLSKKPADVSSQTHSTESAVTLIERCKAQLVSGDIVGAEETCTDALALFPEDVNVCGLPTEIELVKCLAAADKRFPGPQYLEWLDWFHAHLKPASYLEIGVESGQSLRFARAPTRAVGVDPAIQIVHSQENWVKLFKLTSDDFFATHDPKTVFGAETIDLSFIDGLHTFDQALKDFINIERFSNAGSVALFHDIFPVTPATATRDRNTIFWVGDTWKVMFILLKYRPDLKIFTIPTYPSGLGVVTGLNPESRILQTDFDRIYQEAMELELSAFPHGIDDQLRFVENDFAAVAQRLC